MGWVDFPYGREIIMSMQHRLPDQVVRADPGRYFVQSARKK